MRKIATITLSLATLAVLLSFKSTTYSGKAIAIIVNSGNSVTALTEAEAKLYYLRKVKKRWPDINKNIQPADRSAACPERDTFYEKILKMSADNVERYFSEKEYQNAEPNRKKVKSDAEMIQFVTENVGAIGYVSAESVSGNKDVKVVLTVQ